MRILFIVVSIPVSLDIKIQFVADASVPVDNSSQVKVKFTYDSDLGFKYDGTDVQKSFRLGPYKMNDEITQTGVSSEIAASGSPLSSLVSLATRS